MEDVRKQEKEEGTFRRGELPGQFTARKLFGWSDKRYNKEYWARLERNWRQQKGGRTRGRRTMETIKGKKKKSNRKVQDLESGQRKMTMKWEISVTFIMNYKNPRDEEP